MSTEVETSAPIMESKDDVIMSETAEVKVTPELEGKIIKQVEFYFGDFNMGRDKFMQEQVKLDNGWISLEIMLRFNRLKALCDDAAAVAAALKKSTSGLIEVNDDDTKIRRAVAKPIPVYNKERSADLKLRSVFAKGFPLDATLDSLMAFFEKFGKVEWVQMRRDQRKQFKGSCFVVFASSDSAENFLKTPEVSYNDDELERVYKHDYYIKKNENKKKNSQEERRVKDEQDANEGFQKMYAKGAILKAENVPADSSVDELKAFFGKFGTVKWIDINTNDVRVRYDETDSAKAALEKAAAEGDGKICFKEANLLCTVLEGDQEEAHWKALFKSVKDHASKTFKPRFKGKRAAGRSGGPPSKFRRGEDGGRQADSDGDE